MKTQPIIAIIGGTIWGNRGAEAMLVTTIGRIRQDFPDAEFNVFSYYPHQDRDLITDPRVHILDATPRSLVFNHFLGALIRKLFNQLGIKATALRCLTIANTLEASNLLLDIGGITFSDGREKFLPFNILTIWPAMLLGTPVVKLAQAVGPFEHAINRGLARHFLVRCKHVFVRGESSARHITHLNLPPNKTTPAADIAFLYQPAFSLSGENSSRVSTVLERIRQEKNKGKKIVIISPSILIDRKFAKGNIDYAGMLLSTVSQLDINRSFFIFMPNATREGSLKHHNNDILIIDRIQQRFHNSQNHSLQNAAEFLNFDINTSAIRSLIDQADLLITSRYHAMISGLALNIPTIVIGWGHKYHETMKAFGQSRYVLNTSQSEFDLAGLVLHALDHSVKIRKELQRCLPDISQLAEKQFTNIRHYLK
jgi:colanic acid/amylovoran biosynthesis protein